MRDTTIARNYAAALLELGERHGEAQVFADAFEALEAVLASEPRVGRFLDTPKIDPEPKQAALRRALEGRVPQRFLHFVLVVVAKRRQRLLADIAAEYQVLLDEHVNRIHAQVTVARAPDEATELYITERLSALLGKSVVPHITVNPAIMGGLVVRFGDRVLDGSLRRQLLSLKREMMHAYLPGEPAASA